ncbi:MAG: TonB family protein [Oceanobacter sp.]
MSRVTPGYASAILFALILHAGVAALFFIEWPNDPKLIEPPTPSHVKATLVLTESAAAKQRVIESQKKQQQRQRMLDLEKQVKQEKLRKEKEQKRIQKQREVAAKQKAAEEEKRLEKQRMEKEQREAEKRAEKERLERDRKKAEQLAEQKRQEETLQQAVAEEEKKLAEQSQIEQESRERAVVLEQTDLIRTRITNVWVYPPNVKPEQEVTLKISLVPTGQVITVTVVKGSGNAALDRSVEQAVYKASPLPVPTDIVVFEKHFRNFTLLFRPENASW